MEKTELGCHGFTVFGKAVLFKDVIEPGKRGLVENSKTVAPLFSDRLYADQA